MKSDTTLGRRSLRSTGIGYKCHKICIHAATWWAENHDGYTQPSSCSPPIQVYLIPSFLQASFMPLPSVLSLTLNFESKCTYTLSCSLACCYLLYHTSRYSQVPCNTTASGVHSACCGLGDPCTKNGYCFGGSGVMYRGACTDPSWLSDQCCPQCRDGILPTKP